MADRNNGGRDIVLAHQTYNELLAEGYTEALAAEAVAFGVFIRRAEAGIEPRQADHDYTRSIISARAYLQQIAPEELDR